jgi:hypothetical protein
VPVFDAFLDVPPAQIGDALDQFSVIGRFQRKPVERVERRKRIAAPPGVKEPDRRPLLLAAS